LESKLLILVSYKGVKKRVWWSCKIFMYPTEIGTKEFREGGGAWFPWLLSGVFFFLSFLSWSDDTRVQFQVFFEQGSLIVNVKYLWTPDARLRVATEEGAG
jgi:hypothetical protein